MPSKGKDKKDALKNKECDELIRLCGQSVLYLPVEYASGPLNVPTCFRATGQYLIQHGRLQSQHARLIPADKDSCSEPWRLPWCR